MTAPRDIADVISQMLELIPQNETDLRTRLTAVRESAAFAAPEMMGIWWERGAEVLEEALPKRAEAWAKRVLDIWMGRNPQ